jgi:hypothetical protein
MTPFLNHFCSPYLNQTKGQVAESEQFSLFDPRVIDPTERHEQRDTGTQLAVIFPPHLLIETLLHSNESKFQFEITPKVGSEMPIDRQGEIEGAVLNV